MSEYASLSISIRHETKEKVALMQNICIFLFSLLIYTTYISSILPSDPFKALFFFCRFSFLMHCTKFMTEWFCDLFSLGLVKQDEKKTSNSRAFNQIFMNIFETIESHSDWLHSFVQKLDILIFIAETADFRLRISPCYFHHKIYLWTFEMRFKSKSTCSSKYSIEISIQPFNFERI